MKTVRFSKVVAAAGAPQVHSLWLAPGKDPALKRAVRECRVMTIHQMLRGTKKDYGTVGLQQAGHSSQVLVFQKSLGKFGEARIVGIDYALIVQPEPKDPAPAFIKTKAIKPPVKALRQPLLPASARAKQEKQPPPVGSVLAPTSRVRSPRGATHHSEPARPERALPPRKLPPTREELLTEIRRAVRELKAGKAVAAHERLKILADDE